MKYKGTNTNVHIEFYHEYIVLYLPENTVTINILAALKHCNGLKERISEIDKSEYPYIFKIDD